MPIFPDRYDFEVATDKKKQFKIVAELLKQANTIIVATDSDREGENIAWSIIHKANAFSKDKTYKRLWINSLEKDVIRSGFQNLQPGMNYYPFYWGRALQLKECFREILQGLPMNSRF